MSRCAAGRIRLAGVRERSRRRLQTLQIRNALLIGDGEQHDVPALLGASDGEHPDARRCRGEGAAVGVGGRGIRPVRRAPRGFDAKTSRGDGTVAEAGRYETHGDRKRGSVVAAAISAPALGSGMSGAADWALSAPGSGSEKTNAQIKFRSMGDSLDEFPGSKWDVRACGRAQRLTIAKRSIIAR